jgi:hypothetical protein
MDTYFPNEVPMNCEFNQTLAAKAVECQAVLRNGSLKTKKSPSPPLMDKLTEVS